MSERTSSLLGKVHHINFLVKDLDAAVARYEAWFGIAFEDRERLEGRGVNIARFKAGETWIVLVQPTDPDGIPGRHLAEHGEGFFLISYEVEDLDGAMTRIRQAGGGFTAEQPRAGLEDWQVVDLDPETTLGTTIQLVHSKGDAG